MCFAKCPEQGNIYLKLLETFYNEIVFPKINIFIHNPFLKEKCDDLAIVKTPLTTDYKR